jgi:beta-lactamase superfamily II metal-dependent hydrolase
MPPTRLSGAARIAVAIALTLAFCFSAAITPAGAVTPNGRLQIIHLDVGQGDGAIIISPLGQVAVIDEGQASVTNALGRTVLQQFQDLGVTHVDHHFVSHYHNDHFGNFPTIFGTGGVSLDYGWDGGGSYTTSMYTNYVNTLGNRRRTLVTDQVITMDSLSAHPVTIKCEYGVVNADPNTASIVLKLSYGEFDMVFGGDLPSSPGENTAGPLVGPVEVYKVHHHGSATSTAATWLSAIQAKIGVISVGNTNTYGHPTSSALGRLHTANVKTYWTEFGKGVAPLAGWDKYANGQVIISATWQGGGVDTVRSNGVGGNVFADTFTNSGSAGDVTAPAVSVTSPNGGETWKAGSTQAITWTATDAVGVTSVDLAWSTDGGATFPNALASGIANSGSWSWTVPNVPTGTARVRVLARDAAGNLGRDSSATNFTIDRWSIVASAGAGGGITPSGTVPVVQGASQGFSIAPATGYHVEDVLVNAGSVGAVTSYTFNNVAANHTIAASFGLNTYTIDASAGPNGSITPSGAVAVSHGASQAFAIHPATGYHVLALTVDGGGVTPDTSYTFSNVTAAHSIAATFSADQFTLAVSTVGGGTVTKSPDLLTYPYGTNVQLDAVPVDGWAFAGWSGDTTSSADSVIVTIIGSKALTATFVDVALPTVLLTSPVGGEAWDVGTLRTISWTASDNVGVDSVNVDYSMTGPAGPWLPVAHGLGNSGSYPWTVPAQASDSALVRVMAYDPAHNVGSAVSDSVFHLVDPTAGVWGNGPAVLALARPLPNPSRSTTLLRFSLPAAGRARLEIVDVTGRRMGEFEGEFAAGPQAWRWDGRSPDGSASGAGLYFVRLITPWGTRTERLVRFR